MNLPQLLSRIAFIFVLAFSLTFCLQSQAASTNPLSFNPDTLRFGQVVVGQSESLPLSLINRGTSSISIFTLRTSTGFNVSSPSLPRTLGAGKSLALTVTFTPTASISDPGTLLINGRTAVNLYGAGSYKGVVATPPSISFGNIQTGTTATSRVTVTNEKNINTTISSTVIKGTGFSVQGLSLPLTLTPGQSFTFTLAFSPKSTGSVSGSFQALTPRNSMSVSIPLNGTGTGTTSGQLSLSPTSISFGNVTVGSSATQSGKLTAVGASVTITSGSSTNSEFSLSGLSLPVTIAAGQSVPFTVAFTPQSSGSASASISFVNNLSTATESLSGSGVAVATHSVSLTWDPSTSQVNGYNVYRSSTTGGPYAKVNSGLNPGTSYIDSSVASSHTYYYVTTAVNSSGQESSYSNQVQVSVP